MTLVSHSISTILKRIGLIWIKQLGDSVREAEWRARERDGSWGQDLSVADTKSLVKGREWGIWLKGEGHKMKENQQSDYFFAGGRERARGIWEEGYWLLLRQLWEEGTGWRRVFLYNHSGVTAGLFGGCSTWSMRNLRVIRIKKKKKDGIWNIWNQQHGQGSQKQKNSKRWRGARERAMDYFH